MTDWRASSRGLVALRDFDPALPPLRVISTGPYRSRARIYVRTTPESYRNSADRVGRQWWARRKARLCPPYHSIRAGRAVDAIGRADPNRSTFANHVLRSRCAGREYDGTSPRSTRFSVGTGSSWDAEYNLCVVQLVTSVGSFWSCPVFIAHQLSASGFSSLAGSEAVDGPAAMRLSRCRGDNFFLSWRFLCSTWGPFLRPDLQRALGAVRRRRQGWASLRLRHKLWHLQPTP